MKHNDTLPNSLFPFMWHFLRAFKLPVVLYVFLAVVAGLWGPFDTVLIKNVINLLPSAKGGHLSVLFLPVGLIVLNFLVLDNVTWRGITCLRAKYVPVVVNRMIAALMDYVLSHSHQFFQDNLSGKLSKHVTTLAESCESIMTSVVPNFLRGSSLLLAAFITAYFVSPIFTLILVLWFAVFFTVSVVMSKKLVTLSDTQALTESAVVGELVDTISNQSNVRIFSKKAHERVRMAPYLKAQEEAYRKTNHYALMMHAAQGGLIAIMMAVSAYFLVQLYGKQLVTVGDFALIFGLTMGTGHMMWFTTSVLDDFNKALGRCKQSFFAIMRMQDIKDSPDAVAMECVRGAIHFSDVEFQYDGTAPLFRNKSIHMDAGQKVGLVGYSGGGKSTFVNLIMRLYDVTDGAITIDGHDIRHVTQASLHENIAMIPQDPVLFQRSLMENIRYGKTDATDEAVVEAAKRAHAHDFIVQLPQQYDALVGERGIKLSGGQRQRIAIARAILKNAPILILDEATSQLDSVTEALIQESLWELMQNKTTIVVAHRLSTLLRMDRILVFDQGEIVGDGAHTDLLAQSSLYKKLWEAQVGGFLGDKTK